MQDEGHWKGTVISLVREEDARKSSLRNGREFASFGNTNLEVPAGHLGRYFKQIFAYTSLKFRKEGKIYRDLR